MGKLNYDEVFNEVNASIEDNVLYKDYVRSAYAAMHRSRGQPHRAAWPRPGAEDRGGGPAARHNGGPGMTEYDEPTLKWLRCRSRENITRVFYAELRAIREGRTPQVPKRARRTLARHGLIQQTGSRRKGEYSLTAMGEKLFEETEK